ncbi:haloacid dehalogenase superfamily, subfamily IA, variant 3 with third motif having DD or ED [Palleronia salina]|uniref:Haloacid dehalogenase superfamily, subfamily IA, variant 3 with third motif having DD or ED n=1 Tax=Palleronia salina TaxID=313368 RepID=A0A1M6FVS0_9RHOB|nr:HAD family phosphatase [Palleronia salina]SHJ01825.1 haloacid dehalogenase superfamily, subfamily IA, variant 3 with third motif having DD or ED [Palleronia salina]
MTDHPFDAVLWDIDGTLADSEPVHDLSFGLAAERLGLQLPEDFHAVVLGKSEDASHAWMTRHVGLTLSLHEWVALRAMIYMDHLDRVRVFDAPVDLYRRVAAAGVAQGFVSNSMRPFVEANLRVLGLNHPMATTITRNDVRDGKPAPEPYLRAAHLLGVAPSRVAVVEDSDTGAAAGAAAGMTVFRYGAGAEESGLPLFDELDRMWP